MRKERWPGEKVLLDNIDMAVRQYASAFVDADPDGDFADHENKPMVVGWIGAIQTLGTEEDDDIDSFIPLVSEGMSAFTAMGLSATATEWFAEN